MTSKKFLLAVDQGTSACKITVLISMAKSWELDRRI